jgi:GNAT superfamily N-acetyltransferase
MRATVAHPAYRLRSPRPSDAEAVLAVLVARDIADISAPDVTLEDLRDGWCSAEFDLSADARVVETADGRIAGYAAMSREVTMVVVAPEHEGGGLGSRLREWAEHRDRARGSVRHRQWIAASNERAPRTAARAFTRITELADSRPPCSKPPSRGSPPQVAGRPIWQRVPTLRWPRACRCALAAFGRRRGPGCVCYQTDRSPLRRVMYMPWGESEESSERRGVGC